MAANKSPEMNYTCEICGREGFNDEAMRSHMSAYHLRDSVASCPFCDLVESSPTEMLLHVNRAHLDYLSPSRPDKNVAMAFVEGAASLESQRAGKSTTASSPPRLRNTRPTQIHAAAAAFTASTSGCKGNEESKFSLSHSSSSYANNDSNSNTYVNNVTEGSASHGSPLRSSLNLQLHSHASSKPSVQECPMCSYTSDSPTRLEEHINRQHFDLISPSFPSRPSAARLLRDSSFNCPLCDTFFTTSSDLELHINIEHKNILSPAKATSPQSDVATSGGETPPYSDLATSDGETPSCPICLGTNKNGSPSPITPDASSD